MTIGELETALDMTRANIRFYEQEGFIRPSRGANNYRDYTQEDVDTLRKVKLLRQLGLSLEEIRQAQRGERPLSDLAAEREEALERQREELAWAGQVCRALREDRAEFSTLDAQKYLDRLDRPADQPGPFDLRADAAPTVSYPWRRFFARTLDYALCGLPWLLIRLFVLRWHPEQSLLVDLLNGYIAYGTQLLLEPLLLSTWGYTPGKWIFGLQVRDWNGNLLSFGQALDRTLGVFRRGEGYGIPFFSLYRNYKCYRRCADWEPMEWEEGLTYTIRDTRKRRGAAFAASYTALFLLQLFLSMQSLLPVHRGALTPEEYADNVNDMCRILDLMSNRRMDEEGNWEDTVLSQNVIVLGEGEGPPSHQLTVNGEGLVTGVRIEEERSGENLLGGSTTQRSLAALAFTAAQRSYNGFTWLRSGVLDTISERPFENYTFQAGDVTVTQEVELRGYEENLDGNVLFADEGAEPYYRMVFTLEWKE